MVLMRTKLRQLLRILHYAGFDVHRGILHARSVRGFIREMRLYSSLNERNSLRIALSDLMPIVSDKNLTAGFTGGHYFFQDLWAARKIYEKRPMKHVDIGSRIDGFIAHLLVFMPVTLVDIRPVNTPVG